MTIGVAEIFIIIFCVSIALFCVYLLYICYLKKCKAYKYENGIPNVALLRPSRIGSCGFKHFSAAPFRASQISISSSDRSKTPELQTPKRPYTFPLAPSTNTSKLPEIPEIRIDPS